MACIYKAVLRCCLNYKYDMGFDTQYYQDKKESIDDAIWWRSTWATPIFVRTSSSLLMSYDIIMGCFLMVSLS